MGGMSWIHWLVVLIAGSLSLAVCFVPTIVAAAMKRSNWPLILLVNFLFGWTGIGWIVCMLWAALGWGDKTVKAA